MDLKFKDIPDIVLACFVFHNFCEEQNIEPILADIDRVIIMERVNAPTKDIVYKNKITDKKTWKYIKRFQIYPYQAYL